MNSNFKFYLYKLVHTPPHKLLPKVYRKANSILSEKVLRYKDLNLKKANLTTFPKVAYSYVNINEISCSNINEDVATFIANMYMNHRFDLLGSGWVENNYNHTPLGVEGYCYDMALQITEYDTKGDWLKHVLLENSLPKSKSIWKHIDSSYSPIDWQLDFKSGFRWSAKKWYKDQVIGKNPGADVKVPWELGRLQHLPQMAIFAIVLPSLKDKLIIEFKNQVLDFIAINPVKMGVNWTCTMDVGIRAANLLLAYDLFKQIDDKNVLCDNFSKFFSESIFEHGHFIVNNFEWSEMLTSNHYLSNIGGLLFIAAYLERTSLTDSWLAFSIQEIISEMEKQFNDDGSNFEASTCYHRLSSEIMIYATSLIYGVLKTDKSDIFKNYSSKNISRLKPLEKQLYNFESESFFPEWYINTLFKSGCFTADITKPNGEIPQIGDNDSGRFLKLSPTGSIENVKDMINKYNNLKGYERIQRENETYWDENLIDHSTLISAIHGLYHNDMFERFSREYILEKSVIESISKGKKFTLECEKVPVNSITLFNNNLSFQRTTELYSEENKSIPLTQNLKFICYPDFGIYLYKSDRIYLVIMAGSNGQNGNAGHTHNDKLSFELMIDGKDKYVDSGAYIYTPIPEMRNKFRSIYSHNTVIVNHEEQNGYLNLFSMKDETTCSVVEKGGNRIKFQLQYRTNHVVREFLIEKSKVIVNDWCNKEFEVNLNTGKLYSNGYGKLTLRS